MHSTVAVSQERGEKGGVSYLVDVGDGLLVQVWHRGGRGLLEWSPPALSEGLQHGNKLG